MLVFLLVQISHKFVIMLVLQKPNINITNPEIPPESISGKFSRLDLNMSVDNRLVNVEIQVKNDVV